MRKKQLIKKETQVLSELWSSERGLKERRHTGGEKGHVGVKLVLKLDV